MAYPRQRLGDSGNLNCLEPSFAAAYPDTCSGVTPQPSTLPVVRAPSIIETILTDVVQFFHPGTPSPRPLYTSGSTSAQSILTSPAALVGLAAVAYLVLSRRR